jgi:biofilm PGA synthesis N-glycosyltransferase PgaC
LELVKILFWISLFITVYTYLGYGAIVFVLLKIRKALNIKRSVFKTTEFPTLTLITTAYNEAAILDEKIANSLNLKYPEGKLNLIFVSDGSTDGSDEVINKYQQVKLINNSPRNGKMHAINTAMEQVTSEVVVFTDANTFLNEYALINIARHYADPSVGAVAGEKTVKSATGDGTAGEGFYWKYESILKKLDSELYTAVGATGELLSMRRNLYKPAPADTVLDDFILSMSVTQKHLRIVYEPEACATEFGSASVGEELKRKIRIAAGGMQSILRLTDLLNPFKYPTLSFQYISHRVLRWTVTPFMLIIVLITNLFIVINNSGAGYTVFVVCQLLFYLAAYMGYLLRRQPIKIKLFFIPYYFCMMNYAVIAGIMRYFSTGQNAMWEKSKRQVG